MIFGGSFVLHLFIEAPFNNLRKLVFDKKVSEEAKKVDWVMDLRYSNMCIKFML